MSAHTKDDIAVAATGLAAATTALTAVFATLCCAGPLVVGLIGVSGAVAAAELEPYRAYLLSGAAALLVVGFWRAYRKSEVCEGGTCAPGVRKGVKALLWIAATLTAASAVAPHILAWVGA